MDQRQKEKIKEHAIQNHLLLDGSHLPRTPLYRIPTEATSASMEPMAYVEPEKRISHPGNCFVSWAFGTIITT